MKILKGSWANIVRWGFSNGYGHGFGYGYGTGYGYGYGKGRGKNNLEEAGYYEKIN